MDEPIPHQPEPWEIEPPINNRYWNYPGEHEATAIGYICFEYSKIESSLARITQELLGCSREQRRAVYDAAGASIQTKCDLVLKLATLHPAMVEVFSDLEWLLTIVKSDLAPIRNRIIHDSWVSTGVASPMFQRDERTFLSRQQSRQAKRISPEKNPLRSLQALWDFANLARHTAFTLSDVEIGLRRHMLDGHIPEPLLQHLKEALTDWLQKNRQNAQLEFSR